MQERIKLKGPSGKKLTPLKSDCFLACYENSSGKKSGPGIPGHYSLKYTTEATENFEIAKIWGAKGHSKPAKVKHVVRERILYN